MYVSSGNTSSLTICTYKAMGKTQAEWKTTEHSYINGVTVLLFTLLDCNLLAGVARRI